MDMSFPPNSDKSQKGNREDKKPEKKIEKVITGEVIQRKTPLGRKFKSIFFGGDFKGVAVYVATDVLLPAMRNLIVDATVEGTKRVVYGERHTRTRPADFRSRVNYHNPLGRMARDPREMSAMLPGQPPHSSTRNSRTSVNDIVLVSRDEADLVLERLRDIIDMYEVASVGDLYELLGLPLQHTDNKWGWTNLNSVSVRQVREGYLIEFPTPEQI